MQVRVSLLLLLLLTGNGIAHGQTASTGKVTLAFEGNRVFSAQELLEVANKCLDQYSRALPVDESDKVNYCLVKVRFFLTGKGYLRAMLGEPRREQIEGGVKVIVPVEEGALYRLGQVKIESSKLLTPTQILGMLAMKTGDVADGERLSAWLNKDVKRVYEKFGYIQYGAELDADFHLEAGAREGIADFTVTIDEGHAFAVRAIKFEGNGDVPGNNLRRLLPMQLGDIFNKELFEEGLKSISRTGQFEVIDADKDVDYTWDQKLPELDLTIRLKKRAATSNPF